MSKLNFISVKSTKQIRNQNNMLKKFIAIIIVSYLIFGFVTFEATSQNIERIATEKHKLLNPE